MSVLHTAGPKEAEKKWYSYWEENNFFHSEPDERASYTIVIPPPNVTGVLHMGHMLNNTIQDVLVRHARMTGKNACWVPGTDHASIATEAKVVDKLKKEGIDKKSIGREAFLEHAWEWKEKYGGTILEQLKQLGCSCDWDRTRFTMDPELSAQVTRIFVKLFRDGLIYRGYRMVNWDPEAKTNISDEEVVYKQLDGFLYYLKYKVAGDEDTYITVATTRPETIFGDVAVCVHPDDEKYKDLIGKTLIVPYVGREIPVISDAYVDPEFGTGALKITPAHDVNDYEIGRKYNLESIDCLDEDGRLNAYGGEFEGKDRFVVRKELAAVLEERDLLLKKEKYTNNVGTSERTGAVIEPKISNQWFLKMQNLAEPALEAVMSGEIKFYPEKFKNTYRHWLENITDWNISRQLWWGHRIPAWYYGSEQEFVVAETAEEALQLAKEKSGNQNLTADMLRQDEDVLDTWFSSWIWPMSVFNGINEPDNSDYTYYYPTQDLVTAPDIIFFWVARMIMAGLYFDGRVPFKNVYFTGIVRDSEGRKMSKSLGNSPDTLALIDTYGADAVRAGILMSAAAGNDILYDESLLIQGRNFSTKITNAFRLVSQWKTKQRPLTKAEEEGVFWFRNRLNEARKEISQHYTQYRISDVLKTVYTLIWDDFCSWYLEIVKPDFGGGLPEEVLSATKAYFEELLQLLHPFMPFLTEEIWQQIRERGQGESIMISQLPHAENAEESVLRNFDECKEWVAAVRTVRQKHGISFREEMQVTGSALPEDFCAVAEKLTNAALIHSEDKPDGLCESVIVKNKEYFIPIGDAVNLDEERAKTEEEIQYLEGFLQSVMKKLSNEKFVAGAPPQVVENEKKKKQDAEEKIQLLKNRLEDLK